MSTSSMLHARNNVSPARYCRVIYLALAGGLPSGAQNKPNARWFGCLQNTVRAVVLLPGKQHEWKGAQEVRNGSRLCENSDVELARREFVSITLNKKRTALAVVVEGGKGRKQFCAFSARARFHTWGNSGPEPY